MIQKNTELSEEKTKVFPMIEPDDPIVGRALNSYSKAKGQDRERISEALTRLLNGNIRFVNGNLPQRYPNKEAEKTVDGQKPFATLVICSDSRVPETYIFDAGIGDIFVVRVAGIIPGKEGLASLEYAVDHLQVPLIGIIGHDKCGAVTAAFSGANEHGNLAHLLEEIKRNIEGAISLDKAIDLNTLAVRAGIIASSEIVSKAYAAGKIAIVPMRYHMAGNLGVEIL